MRAARRAGTALAAKTTTRTAIVAATIRPTPGVLTSNSNDSARRPSPTYGSDLLGALEDEQTREFQIRGEVMPAIDVIRSATLMGAEVVRQEGKLGVIEPGAFADLLVVDGDPLKNLGLFKDGGPHLSAIVKGGRFHKNTL